ncbi:unnamed protein product [Candida verbasci]|uniref:Protein MSS2, mitochondrial n=1 Tax=Candida verbasci TaxID=1227364 RepID=A0A9W4XCH7_9ASCO|nr:unnamed protein product [Candida verbasci]
MKNIIRYTSTTTSRPSLLSILPSKRTLNRILFDQDARLSYNKMIPILTTIYNNLSTPDKIKLPIYTKSSDLMEFQTVLKNIRNLTSSYNKNLIDLENELIEQSAELGNSNAISILSFETVQKRLKDESSVSLEDFNYANSLIQQLLDSNHALTYRYAGNLAWEQNIVKKAIEYWKKFIELEPNSIESSHVYYQLGYYYLTYESNPFIAKEFFEKSIAVGELDNITIKSHFYLGQLIVDSNPKLAKYHWELSSSKGLIDSIYNLGFLEMNVFNNLNQAIEWFKLGVESNSDINCLIGQFDCYIKMNKFQQANKILKNLQNLSDKIKNTSLENVPDESKNAKIKNEEILELFFKTRGNDIKKLNGNDLMI